MPCTKYEELHKAVIDAMCEEDDAHRNNARRVPKSRLVQERRTAHSRVLIANTSLKRHIDGCQVCRAEGKTAVDDQTLDR